MEKGSVLVVCLSPAFQQTSVFSSFCENEVNRASDTRITPAGKGINVSRVLGKLGVRAVNLAQLGGPRKVEFIDLCREFGTDVRAVDSGRHIRNCVTIVNEKGGTSTELVEENPPVESSLNDSIMEVFADEMPKHSVLVITGSSAKGFSSDLFGKMAAEAKRLGKSVILDIRGETLEKAIPSCPDIIKPNLQEFAATFMPGVSITEEEDSEWLFPAVEEKAAGLFRDYGIRSVITRGKYDTWFYDGGRLQRMPSKKIKPVNTIGCGDTFTASIASSFIEGKELAPAVRAAMDLAAERAQRRELI